ncbi:MAG: formimidoylglutamase [Bacteriovoracaceae bacterium]|nr:formimidoylglutamase [Bacteriovoracaceae bacterium]NUM58687.1 formimidoylglutamase [Pseudobdellovibrionaceae bacterium]
MMLSKELSLKSNQLLPLIKPISKDLLFSKNDTLDPRLGDIFKTVSDWIALKSNSFTLIGYQDDRGIKNNGGRLGAAVAPQGIRNYFYRLTYPYAPQDSESYFQDLGNFSQESLPDLLSTQENLKELIQYLHDKKSFVASLGGGHDYGYPDAWGFITSELLKHPHQKPLILNFDAHLDVRDDSSNINSGTPFYKILKEFHGKIDFYEIGIQTHCNSVYHAHFVENHKGKIISLNDIRKHSLNYHLSEIFKHHQDQSVFVSLDIDVMSAAEAPGCSQSWPSGLSFQELNSGFDILSQFRFWKHLGIYEVSPPLDVNGNTQRAAALFLNRYLHYYLEHAGIKGHN